MTDLGLSNGYFCVVEQDDTFKFLIDYGSLEKPWGKGFLNGRLFPQTFAGAVYNVCIRGCKRYPWRTYVFAFKVDQIGPGGCSALQGRMQCTAGTVAVHCGDGCSALRLRWAKLAPKSSVLFWTREKGGETRPIWVTVAPTEYLLSLDYLKRRPDSPIGYHVSVGIH